MMPSLLLQLVAQVVVAAGCRYDPGGGGGGGGGGTSSLRVSRYAPWFCPPFSASGRSFCPPNLTLSTILFRSCRVPFRSPPFSACRRSFCLQIWPNLSFYSDLVGSHFELRAVHPYWFWPGVPPGPLVVLLCMYIVVDVVFRVLIFMCWFG